MTTDLSFIFVTAALVNNIVLVQGLGICPVAGSKAGAKASLLLSLSVLLLLLLSTAAAWPVYQLILVPMDIAFTQPLVFLLLIAGLVQLAEVLLRHFAPDAAASIGIYLPLTASDCAVMGVLEEMVYRSYSFSEAMVYALACGTGFALSMMLFCAVRLRIEDSDIPQSFRGTPAALIAASIVSLIFMGFTGLAEGMFGM